MSDLKFLQDACNMADGQAERLSQSLEQTQHLFPLTSESLAELPLQDVAFLDMLTTRFGKLQDIIGNKVFTYLLAFLGEGEGPFRDRLNKLEKYGFLRDANWWMDLREMRNDLAHEYPDDSSKLLEVLNKLPREIVRLLQFWDDLRPMIHARTAHDAGAGS